MANVHLKYLSCIIGPFRNEGRTGCKSNFLLSCSYKESVNYYSQQQKLHPDCQFTYFIAFRPELWTRVWCCHISFSISFK